MVTLNLDDVQMCTKYRNIGLCTKADCRRFHLCKFGVLGNCRNGNSCRHSYSLGNPHNQQLLRQLNLDDLYKDDILQFLKQQLEKKQEENTKAKPGTFEALPPTSVVSLPEPVATPATVVATPGGGYAQTTQGGLSTKMRNGEILAWRNLYNLEDYYLCPRFITFGCTDEECEFLHYPFPYVWCIADHPVLDPSTSERIEEAFSDPKKEKVRVSDPPPCSNIVFVNHMFLIFKPLASRAACTNLAIIVVFLIVIQ